MKQYTLLVIDDGLVSENRKAEYETILGPRFQLKYIESGSQIGEIPKIKADAYILDMVLDGWTGNRKKDQQNLFIEVVDLIGARGPVILVSSRWSPEVVGWLNNSNGKIAVCHFYEWAEFQDMAKRLQHEDDKENLHVSISLNIEKEINKFNNRDLTTKDQDESITILHLSDLQFGDKLTDLDSAFLQYSLAAFLREKKIYPDFLCLTGDVTFKGELKEIEMAVHWINTLCKGIFPFENYKSRILLVPGNHDVNMVLNAADTVTYNFSTKKLTSNKTPQKQFQSYGLLPFKELAYALTQDPSWFTIQNDLCFINDRFLHWGVRFIHLNSVVEQSWASPKKVDIPESAIERIYKSLHIHEQEDLYTILLSHHGKEDFEINEDDPTQRWGKIRNVIDGTRTNLFLYGHRHGFNTWYGDNEEGTYIKHTKFHRTATLMLNEKAREIDKQNNRVQNRGFSVITLKRENGAVKKSRDLEIAEYEVSGAKISRRN
ncbi:hypothetical protein GWC95_15590 [Sediminibacterium roseum]|uniref:Calcineurin-like phosphoesterase domain-containing protein n=1 Tax=Sediminibacterium roseum TaxID=1978412 RepID=A0ABX0A2J5_9BACT|nr:metallophosphoesterase [Sediminibacterium roseum]NCI51351.1 hypothetical protein [Sediminibacterium roseum]